MTLAAVILTKNEALDIADCIATCRFADEVIVVDSMSTDDTANIARSSGATVYLRPFRDYADQRNAALKAAGHHAWVLMIDADERVPAEMAAEVMTAVEDDPPNVGLYRVRRKDFFQGSWLKRSSGYPTWFARLLRTSGVRFTRVINEECEVDRDTRYLSTHIYHYPFSKGLEAWIDRHNRYSSLEATTLMSERSATIGIKRGTLTDPVARRKTIKRLFYRMPFRSFTAFVGLYVIRGGFLDGRAGWHYCRLRSIYEYLIELKLAEQADKGP